MSLLHPEFNFSRTGQVKMTEVPASPTLGDYFGANYKTLKSIDPTVVDDAMRNRFKSFMNTTKYMAGCGLVSQAFICLTSKS